MGKRRVTEFGGVLVWHFLFPSLGPGNRGVVHEKKEGYA